MKLRLQNILLPAGAALSLCSCEMMMADFNNYGIFDPPPPPAPPLRKATEATPVSNNAISGSASSKERLYTAVPPLC
jgi:hypothetical protein